MNPETKKQKQIMVTDITNLIDFVNDLSKSDKFDFGAKLSDKYVKILPNTLRDKMRFNDQFKRNNIQFYIVLIEKFHSK